MTRQLLLSYDFPPIGGGIARWMGELARGFPPGELLVSTGTVPGGVESDTELGAAVDRLPIGSERLRTIQGLMHWSRRAQVLSREYQARFLWCGNLRPAAYPAKWVRDRIGVPYGVFVHGGDLLALQRKIRASRVKRSIARALLGSASVIVANSRWTAELAGDVMGELGLDLVDGRIRTVALGADPSRFRPGLDTEPLRERYGLPPGRWLLTVARLVPHKGVDTTLRALSILRDTHPDVRYAVAGSGGHRAALMELAGSLGIADRVHFLPEASDRDLPALYNLATVYVGASRQENLDVEGFGLSLAEAASSGLPVVAGRSGGIADAVREGETGVLVDPRDHVALAAAIGGLLQDAALVRRLGDNGRVLVERHLHWNRVVGDLQAITAELVTESPRRPPAPSGRR